ncbi:hypothetical protein, partial [Klebsiella pneumoniae]|uniref:hypothetical protein n=1 Tax=Klebsiella pneumoniae TaxID=573 RepID=UPI0030D7762B
LLALRDDIQKVTVLSPDEGMQKLDQDKADVAFVWAPVAGWLNKTAYGDKYRLAPTEGVGLLWQTAIGFARSSTVLRDEIDVVLPSLQGEIDRLFVKYGVPNSTPIKFGEAERSKVATASTAAESSTVGQSKPEEKPAPASLETGARTAGQELFNG